MSYRKNRVSMVCGWVSGEIFVEASFSGIKPQEKTAL